MLFWRFESRNDVPVGFGGLEIHGSDALLRSVVILPRLREIGMGRAIVETLEIEAAARQCRAIYLLTTSQAEFFARLGYAPCEPRRAGGHSREQSVHHALPATADVMSKRVG